MQAHAHTLPARSSSALPCAHQQSPLQSRSIPPCVCPPAASPQRNLQWRGSLRQRREQRSPFITPRAAAESSPMPAPPPPVQQMSSIQTPGVRRAVMRCACHADFCPHHLIGAFLLCIHTHLLFPFSAVSNYNTIVNTGAAKAALPAWKILVRACMCASELDCTDVD